MSPITVDDDEITFTNTFKSLGSMLAYDLKTMAQLNAGLKVLNADSLQFESNA